MASRILCVLAIATEIPRCQSFGMLLGGVKRQVAHRLLTSQPCSRGRRVRLQQSSLDDATDDAEQRIFDRLRRRRQRRQQEYADELEDDNRDNAGRQRDNDEDADDVDPAFDYGRESLFDDKEEDDDDDEDVDYDYLFENKVIPNPLLDSMDPDGAADRFPELAADPKFWIEMALFVAFIEFLSTNGGPRDIFADLPLFQ